MSGSSVGVLRAAECEQGGQASAAGHEVRRKGMMAAGPMEPGPNFFRMRSAAAA
ncbi:hypothetical protein [Streptomyces sp. NPDC058294]|uniref:hypothetical protein n=1 Tax=Streptomyces sp. NPDC058294 TaxID=3346430 RepID=UPI0036ED7608